MHRLSASTAANTHLVVNRYKRVVRGEGTSGALAVHQQGALAAIHHVLLHLGDVVRHVVDDVHVKVVRSSAKHFGEGLQGAKGRHCEGDVTWQAGSINTVMTSEV